MNREKKEEREMRRKRRNGKKSNGERIEMERRV